MFIVRQILQHRYPIGIRSVHCVHTYQKHIQMTASVAVAAAEKCLHFESMDFVHLHIDVSAVGVVVFLFVGWFEGAS